MVFAFRGFFVVEKAYVMLLGRMNEDRFLVVVRTMLGLFLA